MELSPSPMSNKVTLRATLSSLEGLVPNCRCDESANHPLGTM